MEIELANAHFMADTKENRHKIATYFKELFKDEVLQAGESLYGNKQTKQAIEAVNNCIDSFHTVPNSILKAFNAGLTSYEDKCIFFSNWNSFINNRNKIK